MEALPPPPKAGYLWKKGGGSSLFGRRNWKRRYFRVEAGELSYYDNEHQQKALSTISLRVPPKEEPWIWVVAGADASKSRRLVLQANFGDGTQLSISGDMSAAEEQLLCDWRKAIKNHALFAQGKLVIETGADESAAALQAPDSPSCPLVEIQTGEDSEPEVDEVACDDEEDDYSEITTPRGSPVSKGLGAPSLHDGIHGNMSPSTKAKAPSTKRGWLWKKGTASSSTGRRSWKRRWFVLHGPLLRYYDKEVFPSNQDTIEPLWTGDLGAARLTPEGELHAEDHVDAKNRHTLEVNFKDRILKLATAQDTPEEQGLQVLTMWRRSFEEHHSFFCSRFEHDV